jgi:protein CWC15
MTTAHRPTWKAAVGKSQEGGWTAGGASSAQRSILDAPAHTKLKSRNDAHALQSTERSEILKNSLLKIKEMEDKSKKKRRGNFAIGPRKIDEQVEEEGRMKLLKSTNDIDEVTLSKMYDDADDDGRDNGDDETHKWSEVEDAVNLDSDLDASDSDSENDSDDDSDDEDEEDLLQAELAKIRAEREHANAKIKAEAAMEEQDRMEEAALMGNPLLNVSTDRSGKLKRRWNDDVVFRNQAKDEPNRNKKRFINDTVRNDFHKRFLSKFIR